MCGCNGYMTRAKRAQSIPFAKMNYLNLRETVTLIRGVEANGQLKKKVY